MKVVYIQILSALIFNVFTRDWSFFEQHWRRDYLRKCQLRDVPSRALLPSRLRCPIIFSQISRYETFDGEIYATIRLSPLHYFLFRALHIFYASCGVRKSYCPALRIRWERNYWRNLCGFVEKNIGISDSHPSENKCASRRR